ncbi:TPA: NACHT domain-containing protein, partial [Pseudomonas aeruginosa]|nr:NACHT domain-containing protein [Pseudomonas aeruginosa]
MDLASVVSRLGGYIAHFDKHRDLTSARKAGEAFCRIILLSSDAEEVRAKAQEEKFNNLLNSLTPSTQSMPKNHLKRIKGDLAILQSFGNFDSHDNDDVIEDGEIERVKQALDSLIHLVFNSKEKFYIDQKIPDEIYLKIHKSVIGTENWRCEKIVSIVYPNRKIFSHQSTKDFEFFALNEADGRKIGILFLGRNITFKQVFDTVFAFPQVADLSSLTFLFPVEISMATGTPVRNRKDNIVRVSKEFTETLPRLSCTFEFIEDYIWDRCLPEIAKEITDLPETPYFIDQNLHSDSPSMLSLDFVESLIKNKLREKKPIYVVFGDGGAGKTTFCEQTVQLVSKHQSRGLKKKAILISSFDIPEELPAGIVVDSLPTLYSLVADLDIDPHSLGLNISSGNILIIIDGLDEIQSKLKERFSLEKFIESVKELNDTYQNCSVILTSREINKAAFEIDDVNIFYIKGFDQTLIDKYLHKRFPGENYRQILTAKEIIAGLGNDAQVTPLILRLACELASEPTKVIQRHQKSIYLKLNEPLDKIVYRLMDREIGKQSLGITTCDQYFNILSDVIFQNGGQVSSSELFDLIAIAAAGTGAAITEETATNYHTSTLLARHGGRFTIKYDTIEFLIRARYLTYLVNNRNKESDHNIRREFAQSCYRGGALVKEICKYKNADSQYEQALLRELSEADRDPSNVVSRKLASALLYIYFEGSNLNRAENSERMLQLFGRHRGQELKNIAFYGEFYPLDFTHFTV